MALYFFNTSNIFKFIFKFSIINSVGKELFATIPPTFAAQFTITSGFSYSIFCNVESYEKRFVSFLLEETTLSKLLLFFKFC